MPDEVRKVIAYVTRRRGEITELLVFDHRGIASAGTQVPAGTVEESETPEMAVVRELEEESGLVNLPMSGPIDRYAWDHPTNGTRHLRHVFHFIASPRTPDSWTIQPRGEGEEAEALTFDFRWIPVAEASILSGDQGRSIRFIPIAW